MNQQNNSNRWLFGILAVVVIGFTVMMACLAGAVGGYLVARGQFEQQVADLQRPMPVAPEVPFRIEPEDEFSPQDEPELEDIPFDFDFEFPENLQGALLQEVVPEGPAEVAGLRPGDLITAIDGEPLTPDEGLAELISEFEPGDEVLITYLEESNPMNEPVEVIVILGSHPDDPNRAFLGVRFVPLFPGMEFGP